MKAIVFGGSGFAGSHVADALTTAGYQVKIFDIKNSPYLKEGQEIIIGDILNESAVSNATEGCDVVFNFAAIADIDEAEKRPLDTVKQNVLGNSIILEAARKAKAKRFIFASSLYVYSEVGSFYRSSKQACELFIENYWEVYGLPYTILRYGSLYGPRADEGNYIYRILKQAITEGKITSFGEPEDLREYIHVEDAARCTVGILSKEFENQYIILTGTQAMRRKDLMTMVKEIFRNKIEIEFLPAESGLHYEITPYAFNPRIAKKFVSNYYLDLGQGLLQCLEDIYKKHHPHYEEVAKVFAKDTEING